MHPSIRKAHELRNDAALRLVARGFDPDRCRSVLDALERSAAHADVYRDLAAENIGGRRDHWLAERRRFQAMFREAITRLERDPEGSGPPPGVTSIRIRRELRELRAGVTDDGRLSTPAPAEPSR